MAVQVTDGAVILERFRAARPRLLWLLKEFHDEAQTFEDLLGSLRGFASAGRIAAEWTKTYSLVAKVSHGVLRPDDPWAAWSRAPGRYASALADIAVVNVKKTSGGRTARSEELADAVKGDDGAALLAQVRGLGPEVVIGGGTLGLVDHWFPAGARSHGPRGDRFASWLHDGAVWVDAFHPQYRGRGEAGVTHQAYFRNVREAIARSRPG